MAGLWLWLWLLWFQTRLDEMGCEKPQTHHDDAKH